MSGVRPSRPTDEQWLQDQIWDMIVTCWSERREQRWGIRDVCDQLSGSSAQEISSVEPGNHYDSQAASCVKGSIIIDIQTTTQNSTTKLRLSPQPSTNRNSSGPPNPAVWQAAKSKFLEWRKNSRSKTAPVPNTPTPKRRFTFPTILRAGRSSDPRTNQLSQGGRSQKTTILSQGRNQLQAMVNTLAKFVRSGKSPGTGERPSQ